MTLCKCGHDLRDHDAETGVCVEVLPEPCGCEGFDPVEDVEQIPLDPRQI